MPCPAARASSLAQRAADADEPEELNYIRKHAQAMRAQGLSNAGARLFSNPAGDYGSMVNERVGASNWEDGDELGNTWVSRNAFRWVAANGGGLGGCGGGASCVGFRMWTATWVGAASPHPPTPS
jgi:hypothetical protein